MGRGLESRVWVVDWSHEYGSWVRVTSMGCGLEPRVWVVG